ncbi:MAG: hypothetical protein IJS39_06195 [Synergistaceae bacterium]|nr:hypothetical protein [Synergistaceae bacterium]
MNYPAIFIDNKDAKTCHIEFPSLNYESDIAYSDDPINEAEQELGFALYLCEDAGREFPNPEPINTKALPAGAVVRSVNCDYDRQNFSVKVIDLSD